MSPNKVGFLRAKLHIMKMIKQGSEWGKYNCLFNSIKIYTCHDVIINSFINISFR